MPQIASIADIRRFCEMYAVLHFKLRAEPETKSASLAALTIAILFLAKLVLLTLLPISAIVEWHADCTGSPRP
jgi:hypothetical protein